MRLRNKKTGKIYTLSENLYIEYTQGGKIEVRAIIPGGNMSYYYDSLDKLNEDWEDVKEPLIKDEEIISFISLLERFDRKLSKLCGEEK